MGIVCETQSLKGHQKKKDVRRSTSLCEIMFPKHAIAFMEENVIENGLLGQRGVLMLCIFMEV